MNAREREPKAATADDEPQRLLLHMPVDVRSASLAVLATLASLFALQWARSVVLPILFGVMLSYALTPVVNRLESWRIPRAAGAAVLLAGLFAALLWGAWSLSDQVAAVVDLLPQITTKARELSESKDKSPSAIAKVQQAAAAFEATANESGQVDPAASSASGVSDKALRPSGQRLGFPAGAPTRVILEKPGFDVREYLLSGTLGLLSILGQVAVAMFIALFLLASGTGFRRKMVKLAGPRISQKRVTIETMEEINGQIQRYLVVQVAVSVIVGIATGLAFFAIGMKQAAVWGVVAAVTNLIPYVGAVIVGGGAAAAALVQFGTIDMAVLVGAVSFGIHTVVGNLLTPWWMGRASKMSPFAVFVAVLVFGWLWGISGLLLGVPILLVVKSICDRVDDLKPIGELLGA